MRSKTNTNNIDIANVKFVDVAQAQKITALGRDTVKNLAKSTGCAHKVGRRVLIEIEPLLNAIRKM